MQKNLFLANGYVDLGNYWGVTPYIGGGIGTAYINSTQNVNFYNVNDGSPYRATLTLPAPVLPGRFLFADRAATNCAAPKSAAL